MLRRRDIVTLGEAHDGHVVSARAAVGRRRPVCVVRRKHRERFPVRVICRQRNGSVLDQTGVSDEEGTCTFS